MKRLLIIPALLLLTGFFNFYYVDNDTEYPSETSFIGIQVIKKFEGLKLCQYIDAAGHPTIGFGHKISLNDDLPRCITPSKAGVLLEGDLKASERYVSNLGGVVHSQGRFDALTSLIFNIGGGRFGRSIAYVNLINEDIPGFKYQAFDEKVGFVKADGVILAGLVLRRKAESYLFDREY